MLIVHRLGQGGHRYYLAAVGAGGQAPDRGEAPGRWVGSGAEVAGLVGDVERVALARVLPRGPARVPGFDLTFAAPKSVSVLHGLAPPPVAASIRSAHDEAVDAAIAHLERHACAVRVRGALVPASGFVGAAFRHRVSRAGDPHLHTHAVVANAAALPDGTRRALHSPLLYAEQRGAGAVYQAVLRHRLRAALALEWELPRHGRADTSDVPVPVRRAFSRRRAEVLRRAEGGVRERGWAERVTRTARAQPPDLPRLRERWVATCAELSWDYRPRLHATPVAEPDTPPVDVLPDTDRWTRGDLLVAVCDRLVDGAGGERLEAICDELLASEPVLSCGRGGGLHASPRYTTVAALDRQGRVRAAVSALPAVDGHPIDLDVLRRELSGRRLVIVAADRGGADALAARTGAVAVAATDAAAEATTLGPDDVVALRTPDRLPSAAVAALLDVGERRGFTIVAARQRAARPPEVARTAADRATVINVPGGDLTVASSARTARDRAIDDWLAAATTGRPAVLVAEPDELDEIDALARKALRGAGRLGVDEMGGLSPGDAVRFTTSRPSLGVARHQVAAVTDVDLRTRAVTIRLGDDRRLRMRATQLHGIRTAHAVPPIPQLIVGRGDVFVVGGRDLSPRQTCGASVHRYVTADLSPERTPRRDPPARHRSAALAIGR